MPALTNHVTGAESLSLSGAHIKRICQALWSRSTVCMCLCFWTVILYHFSRALKLQLHPLFYYFITVNEILQGLLLEKVVGLFFSEYTTGTTIGWFSKLALHFTCIISFIVKTGNQIQLWPFLCWLVTSPPILHSLITALWWWPYGQTICNLCC